MLYLTCTIISSVDLVWYGVSRAKDRVSVDCGTTWFVRLYVDIVTDITEYLVLKIGYMWIVVQTKLSPNDLHNLIWGPVWRYSAREYIIQKRKQLRAMFFQNWHL